MITDSELVEQIDELHVSYVNSAGERVCLNCMQNYPCDTVELLDGEQ